MGGHAQGPPPEATPKGNNDNILSPRRCPGRASQISRGGCVASSCQDCPWTGVGTGLRSAARGRPCLQQRRGHTSVHLVATRSSVRLSSVVFQPASFYYRRVKSLHAWKHPDGT